MSNESNFTSSDQCQMIGKCPFFNSFQEKCPALVERLKQAYCLNDNSRCARFHIRKTLGPEHVPVTMMPQQWEWTNMILIDAGRPTETRDPQEMVIPLPQAV